MGHSCREGSVEKADEDGRERKMVNTVTQFCGVAKNKSVTKKEKCYLAKRGKAPMHGFFCVFSFMTLTCRANSTKKQVAQ